MQRKPFDMEQYIQTITEGRKSGKCFICELRDGKNPHEVVYEDEQAIIFLNKYPTLYGYILVAPRQHLESVTGDFTLDQYLALQTLIYHVAEAVRQELNPERVYICSLGSQQANSHVHWHIAPLPAGVPFEAQQFAAMSIERGILDISADEMHNLAKRIGTRLRDIL